MKLVHKPGILNRADELSRRPDYKTHTQPTEEIGLLAHVFVNTLSALELDDTIIHAQSNNNNQIQEIQQTQTLQQKNNQ
jgi:hypothetical protein